MNKLYRSLLLTGIVAVGLAGCGDDVTVVDPPAPPPPPDPIVRAVEVTPDNVTVSPGQTIQMTASVTADPGASPTVTWSSSDATRATVDNSGLVTIPAAAPSGPVAIRATATANGSTASDAATLNVVGTTVTGVQVTPAAATINVGQSVDLESSVQGTGNPSQAVTWSTLDGTIVTVDQNGVVTGIAAGTANVKACSQADATKCGLSSIVVVAPTPATVEIQSVTFTNGAGNEVPVVLTNVFGQIQIQINVDNGDRQLDRIDALIGGVVVASQSFAQAAPQAAAPSLAPRVVSLSTNTMQVRKNGNVFVPVIFNGNNQITANLYVVGNPTPLASNAVPVVMNNTDAIIQPGTNSVTTFQPTPGVGSSITGPTTTAGSTWYGNVATVDISTHFIAFQKTLPSAYTFGSVGCGTDAAPTIVGTPTTGIVLTGVLPCAAAEGVVTPAAAPGATSYAPATSGPDGTGLVAPAAWSTVGSAFTVNSDQRWNLITPSLTALAQFNVDNVGPVTLVDNGAVSVGPAVAFNDLADQQWINDAYAFAQDISSSDAGVGVALLEAHDYDSGGLACTGTVVTTGADYNETVTSVATDGEQICAYSEDLLGNVGTSGPSNYFGVDKGVPLARLLGSTAATPAPVGTPYAGSTTANTQIYSIASPPVATDVFGVEGLDTRAGFDQGATFLTGFPAAMTLTGFNALGTVTCDLGPTTGYAFVDPAALLTILSDTYVRSIEVPILCAGGGMTMPAYVDFSANVTDRAGNTSSSFAYNFAADHLALPNITGLGFTPGFYTPGAPAAFGFSANDDLEVIDATAAVTQVVDQSSGGTALRYGVGSLTALGTRWDNVITNVVNGANASIPYFLFRVDEMCTAAATPYASCPDPTIAPYNPLLAPYITTSQLKLAAGADTADYTAGAAALPTVVSADVADVAGQLSGTPISAPMLATQFNPSTGLFRGVWDAADLIAWSGVNSGPGTAIATHVASTSIVVPFFDGVELWRLNNAAEWVHCGAFPAPTLTDNGNHRFWTYTLVIPTASAHPCVDTAGGSFVGALPIGNYRAMGVKAGAGLFTPDF
ncbi:MAG: Ig-like domain-containing protein [Gemmatimonadales bacterium]